MDRRQVEARFKHALQAEKRTAALSTTPNEHQDLFVEALGRTFADFWSVLEDLQSLAGIHSGTTVEGRYRTVDPGEDKANGVVEVSSSGADVLLIPFKMTGASLTLEIKGQPYVGSATELDPVLEPLIAQVARYCARNS